MSSITYNNETIYTLAESVSPDIPSVFFFSVHKSGSTLMNNLIKFICDIVDYEFVDIQSFYFNEGVPDSSIPESTENIFKEKGYVYSGFRYLPHQYKIPCLNECPVVILIRDPRDAVVSQYFSLSKSHPLPGVGIDPSLREQMLKKREEVLATDIDEFCLRNIGTFVDKINAYKDLIASHPRVKLFQYEEIIYMKKKWIINILHFLDWKLKPGQPLKLANHFNIVPATEQESKHIRQVHPQNYLKKLKPETIRAINNKYRETLIRFNYL
jgi:hypothetical protein